jgi:hypothetical protein
MIGYTGLRIDTVPTFLATKTIKLDDDKGCSVAPRLWLLVLE